MAQVVLALEPLQILVEVVEVVRKMGVGEVFLQVVAVLLTAAMALVLPSQAVPQPLVETGVWVH